MKKTVKAWVILVDGKPNVPNGIFNSKEDCERVSWRMETDPIVPCTITYSLPNNYTN
jgi:hypothetical protein